MSERERERQEEGIEYENENEDTNKMYVLVAGFQFETSFHASNVIISCNIGL